MTTAVQDMVSSITQGSGQISSKTLTELTNDLIKYQKDYHSIQESNDKLKTLKIIRNTTNENLSNAEWMYNLYLFGLISLIAFVIYLVFNTPTQSIFSTAMASVSPPMAT
jgi:predicted nucleic acid-binding protein